MLDKKGGLRISPWDLAWFDAIEIVVNRKRLPCAICIAEEGERAGADEFDLFDGNVPILLWKISQACSLVWRYTDDKKLSTEVTFGVYLGQ